MKGDGICPSLLRHILATWLNAWDGWSGGLLEVELGTDHQGAEHEVGKRQNDVEIFVHVTVMQQVVAIEAAEPPWFFYTTSFRQMHAPVDIFVCAVVETQGENGTGVDAPLASEVAGDPERNGENQDQDDTVPPCHGNGFFI